MLLPNEYFPALLYCSRLNRAFSAIWVVFQWITAVASRPIRSSSWTLSNSHFLINIQLKKKHTLILLWIINKKKFTPHDLQRTSGDKKSHVFDRPSCCLAMTSQLSFFSIWLVYGCQVNVHKSIELPPLCHDKNWGKNRGLKRGRERWQAKWPRMISQEISKQKTREDRSLTKQSLQ